jgi:hypothetical protein
MEQYILEGKVYIAPIGAVRQAFAHGFNEEEALSNVGIDIDIFWCAKYWSGEEKAEISDEDAYIAIAKGFVMLDEEICDIIYRGEADDDLCYMIIA